VASVVLSKGKGTCQRGKGEREREGKDGATNFDEVCERSREDLALGGIDRLFEEAFEKRDVEFSASSCVAGDDGTELLRISNQNNLRFASSWLIPAVGKNDRDWDEKLGFRALSGLD